MAARPGLAMSRRRHETSDSEPIEFVPGEFAYNTRVASLLAPSWVVMLMYGGKTTTGASSLSRRAASAPLPPPPQRPG
eukprot:COSAG06_NODE_8567_length_2128_cov_1.419418_2_plen_78_part_00